MVKTIEEIKQLLKEKYPKSKEARDYWEHEYMKHLFALDDIEYRLGAYKKEKKEYTFKSERGKTDGKI